MPGEFIPLAEETGLIVPIGAWVLDEALRQVRAWQRRPGDRAAPWMSVNLSVRQLADPDLIGPRRRRARAPRVDPSKLAARGDRERDPRGRRGGPHRARRGSTQLGAEIAIDDFGTGYASLSYLRRFPAHTLKIDRSFIADARRPRARARSSRRWSSSAHALGLTAIAEGIETAEQLAVLRELGCDLGQGFHFARPAPAAEIEPLLRSAQLLSTAPSS